MTQQGRANREKPEELGKSRHKAMAQPPLYDQLKAEDEGVINALLKSSSDTHAALLVDAPSGNHRANLVLGLQQAYGNTYVQRLLNSRAVQAKLTVNPPDDEYEREADRVAEAVTQTPASRVQRQEVEEEEVQMKSSQLQRQPIEEEEEEAIQANTAENQPLVASDNLGARINAARTSGQPLDGSLRAYFEPQFGRDFSQVRVHTDAEADRISEKLGAEAFTTGHDVFFRGHTYRPDSESGRGLISHELTHVVQQSGAPILQRQATAATTAKGAEPAKAGVPATEALRALWDTMVAGSVRQAHTALTGSGTVRARASQAADLLRRATDTIHTIRPSYSNNAEIYGRLNWAHSRLETIKVGILAYTGERMSLEELTGLLDPASESLSILTDIRERL